MAPPPDGRKSPPLDPDDLAETLAEAPAIRPTAQPADPALQDTAADLGVDLNLVPDYPDLPPPPGLDVDLNHIYDRPEALSAADVASLSRYDPEADRTSVSVKVRAVTEAVRNSVTTPFGKLILTFPVVLLAIALTIVAFTHQEWPFIAAAAVVMPVALLLAYWRYQAWLGHKRYMYRLLESLGEDVSDFDPHKIYRKVGKSMSQKRPR